MLLDTLKTATTAATTNSGFDLQSLILPLLIVFLVYTMWNSGRKRKRAAAELKSSLGVGAHIVLVSGITGTIVSLDENVAVIETTPGTQLRVLLGAIRGIDTSIAQPEAEASPAEAADEATDKK